MHPESEHIEALFLKHLQQGLSETEMRQLEAWMEQFPELRSLFEKLSDTPRIQHDMRVFRQFAKHTQPGEKDPLIRKLFHNQLFHIPARIAAVFVLLILSLAASVYLFNHFTDGSQLATRYANDIPAGGNKAVLTLGDGRTVVLEDVSRGLVADQPDSKVIKEEDGRLIYQADTDVKSDNSGTKKSFNMIRTPRGGSYQITLPDGTRAWLNAASSLRFPTGFDSGQRVVEASGEVYFDVVEDKNRPFRVKLRDHVVVEVLGTEFNINDFEDEQTFNTTLASGKVIARAFGKQIILVPGQQAQMNPSTSALQVKEVNLLAEISWKDGYFYFDDQPLKVIMKRIARWYNVEVEYRDSIDSRFNLLMLPRDLPVSRLLEMMELTGHVKFNIEGRRIIVMK